MLLFKVFMDGDEGIVAHYIKIRDLLVAHILKALDSIPASDEAGVKT